jgi:hypothetical protein
MAFAWLGAKDAAARTASVAAVASAVRRIIEVSPFEKSNPSRAQTNAAGSIEFINVRPLFGRNDGWYVHRLFIELARSSTQPWVKD